MDILNTTIAIAQKAAVTLQFESNIDNAESKIPKPTLTRIMTSDQMIHAHYPSISPGGSSFIKDQFSKFYKHVNLPQDNLLSLSDGIKVLQFTVQTFRDAQTEALLQQQQQHQQQQQQQLVQSDHNSYPNNNSKINNHCNRGDIIGDMDRSNKKTKPLSDSSDHHQAPFWKRQRPVSTTDNRNTDSLQDTMATTYPAHEIHITKDVNELWHSEYSHLHHKFNNMIELQVNKLRYINSELPFDSKYNVPLRDRIKSIFNDYLERKQNKFNENPYHPNQDDINAPHMTDQQSNDDNNDINDNNANNNNNSNRNNNQCNEMEDESDGIVTEIKINENGDSEDDSHCSNSNPNAKPNTMNYLSNLDYFMKQNKCKIEQFNREMDDQKLLSNILDIVANMLQDSHQQGQSQCISPNNYQIFRKAPIVNLDAMDQTVNQILEQLNTQYHHYIFGHSIPNKIYSLINSLNMVQYTNDYADVMWNSINNLKDNLSSNTGSTSSLIDGIQQLIQSHDQLLNSHKSIAKPKKQKARPRIKKKLPNAKAKKNLKAQKPKLRSKNNNNSNSDKDNQQSSEANSSDDESDPSSTKQKKTKKGKQQNRNNRISSDNDSSESSDSDVSQKLSQESTIKKKKKKSNNKSKDSNNNNNTNKCRTNNKHNDSESDSDHSQNDESSNNADSENDNESHDTQQRHNPNVSNLSNNSISDIKDPNLRSLHHLAVSIEECNKDLDNHTRQIIKSSNMIREMCTIFIEVLKNQIYTGVTDSINYFNNLENRGAILTLIIFKIVKFSKLIPNERKVSYETAISEFQTLLKESNQKIENFEKDLKSSNAKYLELQQQKQNEIKSLTDKIDELKEKDLNDLKKLAFKKYFNHGNNNNNDNNNNNNQNNTPRHINIDHPNRHNNNNNNNNNHSKNQNLDSSDLFQQGANQLSPIPPKHGSLDHSLISSFALHSEKSSRHNPHNQVPYSSSKNNNHNYNKGHNKNHNNNCNKPQSNNPKQQSPPTHHNGHLNHFNPNSNTANSSISPTLSRLPSNYTWEYIFEHEMNPIQFDMIDSIQTTASPKWNATKKIRWFQSQGAKFSNKIYQNGHSNNESRLEFYVGKWSQVQYIEDYFQVHYIGDTARQQLFQTVYNNNNGNGSNNNNRSNNTNGHPCISIHPQQQNLIMIQTKDESQSDFDDRLIIGQPSCITQLLYEPFGINFKLPIFLKYLRLTYEQMNTLPIKIDDKSFCGDPSNVNDLSHYDRLKDLIDFTLDFDHYFIYHEFKVFEQKDYNRNSHKLVRELYLYPRIGKLRQGVNVLTGVIKFIPKIAEYFDHSRPYFKFITNYTDRVTICDKTNNSIKLYIIPRTYWIYHSIQKMHTRGDYRPSQNNRRRNTNNNNYNNKDLNPHNFNNRSIISINYINKMIQTNKMQLGKNAKNNNGRNINPAFIFSDEFTGLIKTNKNKHNNPSNNVNFNGNSNSHAINNKQHNANWGFNNCDTVTTNSNINPSNSNNNNQNSWNNYNQDHHPQFPNGSRLNNQFNSNQSQSQPSRPVNHQHNNQNISNSNSNPFCNQFGTSSISNTNPNSNSDQIKYFGNNNNSNKNQNQQNQNQNPFGSMFSSNGNNKNVGF